MLMKQNLVLLSFPHSHLQEVERNLRPKKPDVCRGTRHRECGVPGLLGQGRQSLTSLQHHSITDLSLPVLSGRKKSVCASKYEYMRSTCSASRPVPAGPVSSSQTSSTLGGGTITVSYGDSTRES